MKIIGANITGSFILNEQDVTTAIQTSNVWSGSVATDITALNAATASLLNYTASNNAAISDILLETASINLTTASLLSYTASQNDRNGTYATTGSNTFAGIQTVNSNLVVTGSITAQTLVVQTITSSVDFVTGSTRFGSISANTHQFTGSMSVSGSINASGSLRIEAPTDVNAYIVSTGGDYDTNLYLGYADAQTETYIKRVAGNLVLGTTNADRLTIGYDGAATFSSSVTAGGKIFTSTSVNDNIIELINSDTTNGYGLYVRGGGTTSGRYVARFKNGADSDVMWVGNTGNVGIGVTPSAWDTTIFKGLQIANSNAFVVGRVDAASQLQIGTNAYYNADGNWKFIQNGYATRYIQNGGVHSWEYSSVSGTAGNNVTFNEAVRITNGGNVLIGTTTDSGAKLTVNGTSSLIGSISVNNGMTVDSRNYSNDITTSWVSIGATTLFTALVYVYWANNSSAVRDYALISINYYPAGVTVISQSNNGGNSVLFQMNGSSLQMRTTSGTVVGTQSIWFKV